MARIECSMNLSTRPARYTPKYDRKHLGIIGGETLSVDVFGVYQVAIDDEVDAYFVVMLPDGRCTYAGIEDVQFVDVAGGDDLCSEYQ